MSHPNADNLLMGSSGQSASFPSGEYGTTYAGTIQSDPEPRQAIDFESQKPAFWDDNSPKMTLPVTLQTDRRDNPDDDGVRTVWVNIPSKMQKAIADAVRSSGGKGLRQGGRLSVTYTGDGEPTRRGLAAPKLYEAAYTPPPSAADTALGVQPQAPQYASQHLERAVQGPPASYGVQAGPGGPQIAPQQPQAQGQWSGDNGSMAGSMAPQQQAYASPQPEPLKPLYQGGLQPPTPEHLGTARAMLAIPGITDDLIKSAAPTVTDEHLAQIRGGQL